MKKTICRALLCLLLAACLLPLTARTAHADKIYDEIVNYQVDVTPNTEDGSLTIQVTLDWKPPSPRRAGPRSASQTAPSGR